MNELRFAELRDEGDRVVSGVAVRYGDTARLPWGEERIQPGAFDPVGDVVLNRQHDRGRPLARTGGGGLTLTDGQDALRIRARMPETADGNDVLALVRAKVMRGLSTEFIAREERFEGGLRIIDRAKLVGIAVVDTGAYPDALIQARMAAMGQSETTGRVFRRVFW